MPDLDTRIANWAQLAEIAGREDVDGGEFDAICDAFPVLLAALHQAREALREIASLPDQTEQWSVDDIAVRLARAALAPEQTEGAA